MQYKIFFIIFLIPFILLGCETIKKKSDNLVEKENQKYGQLVGEDIKKLKVELGNPTDDFINEVGNKVLLYKTKKYGISCERNFEIDQKNVIVSFTSSGCIWTNIKN